VGSGSESMLANSLYFAAFANRRIFPKRDAFRNRKRQKQTSGCGKTK
jgi:hypothetical protein